MTFEKVLPEIKKGRRARCETWMDENLYWGLNSPDNWSLPDVAIAADDWELEENCIEIPLSSGTAIYRRDIKMWSIANCPNPFSILREEVEALYNAQR